MRASCLVLLLCLGFAGPARADSVLSTPIFYVPGSATCNATNLGKKPVTVTLEIWNRNGTVRSSLTPVVVAPNGTESLGANSVADYLTCRVRGNFAKANVRAAALIFDASVVTVPAY